MTPKTRTKSIDDVLESGVSPDAYVTAEMLADEYKLTKEVVLLILDKATVWPIYKVINRGAITEQHPHGIPLGGRPKMGFATQAAKAAVDSGLESLYS